MYDIIIIGAGPAGMTAAIYTARKKLKTLVLSKDLGGQMAWSSDIENYSGFSMISGGDLTLKFKEHLETIKEDLELKLGEEVILLDKNVTSFTVTTKSGQNYFAKSIIIASGKMPRKLNIPGEDKFFGKGVAVCATCDAPLYKGREVVVIGGGNSALDATLSLMKVAKKVSLVNLNDQLGGEEVMRNKILNNPIVTVYNNAKSMEIIGEEKVSGLKVKTYDNTESIISASGIFIEIGYEANASFDQITTKNELGEIIVDKDLQTSVSGIFAAGDINDAWGEQVIIAAGEGAKAAIAVSNYLSKK